MNLKVMLSERSQSQNTEVHTDDSICMTFLKRQNYKYRKQPWLSGTGAGKGVMTKE